MRPPVISHHSPFQVPRLQPRPPGNALISTLFGHLKAMCRMYTNPTLFRPLTGQLKLTQLKWFVNETPQICFSFYSQLSFKRTSAQLDDTLTSESWQMPLCVGLALFSMQRQHTSQATVTFCTLSVLKSTDIVCVGEYVA